MFYKILFRLMMLIGTAALIAFSIAQNVSAQTTAFTYQGKLTDTGSPASGNYDIQFKLFDTVTVGTGNQQGSTVTVSSVSVSNGSFSVTLDFGVCASCFDGANRFLEIAVKLTSGSTFTTLAPRQQVNSTPYAIKSQNAATADGLSVACVSCVTSSQIQSVNGNAVTGTIPVASVPAGSTNYVQNSANQQASSNFNISGDGTAGGTLTGSIVNAVSQFNLNGLRAFTVNGAYNDGHGTVFTASNTFTGDGVGLNTLPGSTPGDITGKFNSFYGAGAGRQNTIGTANAFFGSFAGYANTTGFHNAFFGYSAGSTNTLGNSNAIFGFESGISNTTGNNNAFFGNGAGFSNTTGNDNTFIGKFADFASVNATGDYNTLLGSITSVNSGVNHSTAIGAGVQVTTSNTIVLGTASENVVVPGTLSHLSIIGQDGLSVTGFQPYLTLIDNNAGFARGRIASGAGDLSFYSESAIQLGIAAMTVKNSGRVGIGTTSPDQTLSVNGNASKPGGGSWATFSDERLKQIKGRYTPGLQAVMQLQPIRYEYKRDNALGLRAEGEQIGFSAQAVQKLIPEAVSQNDKGYLLVNNDPILWAMLNAIKEQQSQIKRQQNEIKELKKLVCQTHPKAAVCKRQRSP